MHARFIHVFLHTYMYAIIVFLITFIEFTGMVKRSSVFVVINHHQILITAIAKITVSMPAVEGVSTRAVQAK